MAVISNETKQLIKTSLDTESILKVLGFKVSGNNGTDVRAPCLLHGGDNLTGFSMREDSKTWRCFTRQCEQDSSGKSSNDIFSLVMKVRGIPFVESVKFLATMAGLNLDTESMFAEPTTESRRRVSTNNYIKSISKINKRHVQLVPFSEEIVATYTAARTDYFSTRGFKEDTLAVFEVGAMVDNYGVERATIPIRDSNGRLVSFSGRRTDGDAEPRYRLGYEFKKGSVLYNLHRALQTGSNTLIIVEGFKACWAVHEAGFRNVVACMGAQITNEQVIQICGTPYNNCLVMFDGDAAGKKGITSAVSKIGKGLNVQPLYLPETVSPDDLTREELHDLLNMYVDSF